MNNYKYLTLGLYLQSQFNYQENILIIEIEYWFLLEDNFGQYYKMEMDY